MLDDLVSGRRHHSIVLLASTEPVRIPGSVLDRKEHKLWMSLLAQPAGVAIPLLSRSTDPGITMFSRGELDDMRLGYSDWSEFDSCFPDVGGLTWLSGIGFDAQRRRAMVVVSWGSDEVYSSAAYVLAESEGHWTIVDKYWLRYWVG